MKSTFLLVSLLFSSLAWGNSDELIALQGGQSIRLILQGGKAAQVACVAGNSNDRYHCSLRHFRNSNCIMGNCHHYCVIYTESNQVIECVASDEYGSDQYRNHARARMRELREDGICR